MSDSGKRLFGRSSATAIQDSAGAADGSSDSTASVPSTAGQDGAAPSGAGSSGAGPSGAGKDGAGNRWAETTTTLPAVGADYRSGARPSDAPADPYSATTVSASVPRRPAASDAGAYAAAAPTLPPTALGQPVAAGQPAAAGQPVAAQPVPRPAGASTATVPPRRGKVPKRAERAPRRAKLQVRHLNVWSVLKFSCVLALALFLVWMIVIAVLYGVLDHMHVFSKIDETVQKINGNAVEQHYVSRNVVFGGALIIGLVNTVLFIVLSTIGSVVYNLCADLVGGVEVTLSERE